MGYFIEKFLLPVLLIISVCLLILLPFACYESINERRKLKAECLMDGKKEYECEAILNSGSENTNYIPIVMPVYR